MQGYVDACGKMPSAARIAPLLETILADRATHARFVNTLARMEYVGVRKILKSRRSERLDLDGLQHILDEAVHALRLKKAAAALAAHDSIVRTFDEADTLAGDAGERYLQELDHHAEQSLMDLPAAARGEANYLLTSVAVEVRAQVFYPIYDQQLRTRQAGFSVAAIMKDEGRHLEELGAALAAIRSDWRTRLDPLLAAEEALFSRFLSAIEESVRVGPGAARGASPSVAAAATSIVA